jgi:hypothetical protein
MSRFQFTLIFAVIVISAGIVVSITDWNSPLKPDAALSLISNLVLVGLTAVYVYLTHALLSSQTVPCVVVYVKRRGMLAYLTIENIGKGLARDIGFLSSEQLMFVPARLACTTAAQLEEMKQGPLIQGIPALAPGQKRMMLWGPLHVLNAWLGNRTITVTCTFSENGRLAKPITCPLELHSLCSTGEEFTNVGQDLSDIVAKAVRRYSFGE